MAQERKLNVMQYVRFEVITAVNAKMAACDAVQVDR
jgi:hypothetical protein